MVAAGAVAVPAAVAGGGGGGPGPVVGLVVPAADVVPAVPVALAVQAAVVDLVVPAVAVVAPAVVGRVGLHPAIEVGCADAVPQARKASQAAPWPSPRALAWPSQGPVRRVWPEVARARVAHKPPNRGCSYCDDAQDQAWRA